MAVVRDEPHAWPVCRRRADRIPVTAGMRLAEVERQVARRQRLRSVCSAA